jgi:Membrane proteins related to metalloendopeptidases
MLVRWFTACGLVCILSAGTASWAEIAIPTKSAIAPEIPDTPVPSEPVTVPEIALPPSPSAPPAVVLMEPDKPVKVQTQVILESRTSGCRTNAQELANRGQDLCQLSSPTTNAPRNFPSVAVRRLSEQEIREIVAKSSLPGNGDRQMLFPLTIPALITSAFGYRIHPIDGVDKFHYGTDIAAAEGTPVVAVYGGRVEIAGWIGGLGWAVVISHGDRLETRYGHLSQILVKQGEDIQQGRVIGLVGSSGKSTGAHLHFEMWQKSLDGLWTAIDSTPHVLLALQKHLAWMDFRKSATASVE